MRGGDRGGACPIADVTNEKNGKLRGREGGLWQTGEEIQYSIIKPFLISIPS